MRFIDEATITVKAGKGGHGCVSFRREKYIPRGGPNGGDGGDGGNVIFRVNPRLASLYDFRLKRHHEARNGQPGMGSQCNGKKGDDLVLELPPGTMVFTVSEKGEELTADLSALDSEVIVAHGGRGGKGNEHFKSSTMRAPRFAQPGEEGEEFTLRLELKILADAGIIGLPNAGKSTFITKLSAARAKTAPYPFTTLSPNLGVMIDDVDPDRRLVLADIPGLVEGAHLGRGLGHRFLKHVERTRFLIHILSIEDINLEDPWAGFELINKELAEFAPVLADRPQIEVINKTDLVEEDFVETLRRKAIEDGRNIFFISALHEKNIEEAAEAVWRMRDDFKANDPLARTTYALKKSASGQDEDDEDYDESSFEVVYTRELE